MTGLLFAVNALILLAVAAQAYFVKLQVSAMTAAARLDHERRRKQATIEYWSDHYELRSRLRQAVANRFATQTLTEEQVATLAASRYKDNEDAPIVEALVGYLDSFEYFAAGVNAGVFDLETANSLSGGSFIAAAERYAPWVRQQRVELQRKSLYLELETLALTLSTLRARPSLAQPIAGGD